MLRRSSTHCLQVAQLLVSSFRVWAAAIKWRVPLEAVVGKVGLQPFNTYLGSLMPTLINRSWLGIATSWVSSHRRLAIGLLIIMQQQPLCFHAFLLGFLNGLLSLLLGFAGS